jgi:hypothetical protein
VSGTIANRPSAPPPFTSVPAPYCSSRFTRNENYPGANSKTTLLARLDRFG